jgi:hypothetical protein
MTNGAKRHHRKNYHTQIFKRDFNKLQNELVSIEEFCQYTSLKQEQVITLIVDQNNSWILKLQCNPFIFGLS